MPPNRFTDEQILAAVRDYQSGAKARDVCARVGITLQTLYRWKKQHVHRLGEGGPVQPARNGRELLVPDECSLEFCQQLIEFLNTTGPGNYRLVLDEDGKKVEVN